MRPARLNAAMAGPFIGGSACFVVGSVPGYVDAVGGVADGVTFFVGSIFFTAASFLQLIQAQTPDEFDIAWRLSAERGWMVPAYTLPPDAQNETIMRALVKETMSREHVDTLARDIDEACATLAKKGGAHESERDKIVIGPGH